MKTDIWDREARGTCTCSISTASRVDPLTADSHFNENLPAWSPDGRQIAFIRTHEHGADQDGREDIAVIESRAGAAPRNIARPYAPNSQKLAGARTEN